MGVQDVVFLPSKDTFSKIAIELNASGLPHVLKQWLVVTISCPHSFLSDEAIISGQRWWYDTKRTGLLSPFFDSKDSSWRLAIWQRRCWICECLGRRRSDDHLA